jgi:hypothetical protein
LLDYGIWGILQVKGNAMAHPKMGSLKRTIRQLRAAEVKWWCSKIVARLGCAWKTSSLLAGDYSLLVLKLLSLCIIWNNGSELWKSKIIGHNSKTTFYSMELLHSL